MESRGTPGLATTRSAPRTQARIFCAQMELAGRQIATIQVLAQVGHDSGCAVRVNKARRGGTAGAQPHDHHALALEFHQRSLSVLSATRPHTIDTIQKRITTTVSGMPASSK